MLYPAHVKGLDKYIMYRIFTGTTNSKKVKLATVVKGDQKAPFSIATTLRCRGGYYSFSGLLYFTLDMYLIILSVEQGGIKYHFFFKSFVLLDLGLNPGLPDHWWTLYPLGQWASRLQTLRNFKTRASPLNAVSYYPKSTLQRCSSTSQDGLNKMFKKYKNKIK